MRGAGRVLFAAILLTIAGVLNIIYGIGAIDDANFYTATGTHYVFGSLHTWGWVTLILGVVKLFAAGSLFAGGAFGRWVGVVAACLTAIVALITLPAYPFWGIAAFALAIVVAYELVKARPATA